MTTASRIITAIKYNGAVPAGSFDIQAYTKHGDTSMVSVNPPAKLMAGETFKTPVFIFGARKFTVVGEHNKPMKLAGVWYVVKPLK